MTYKTKSSIRYLLYGINLFFMLSGVILVAVGLSVKFYYRNYIDLVQEQYVYLPNILVVIGIAIFAISILGWCGAVNANPFLTLMFSTFLLLIFFLEITVGISGYLLKTTSGHTLISSLTIPDNLESESWTKLQNEFNCCGIVGPEDWLKANKTKLPEVCCVGETGKCTVKSKRLKKKGCFGPMENYLRENSFIIEIVGFSLAVIQLIGIAFSCYFSNELRKGYQTI